MDSAAERRKRVKAALVLAHRNQDWETAKKLSQEYQALKKHRHCVDCGDPISFTSFSRCRICYGRRRWYSKSLHS